MTDNNSTAKILALLAEMARCLNENMAKVKLTPIDPAFGGSLSSSSAAIQTPAANV